MADQSDKALREAVIRLAHENPRFRPHLLPLVAKKAKLASVYTQREVRSVPVENQQNTGSVSQTLAAGIAQGTFPRGSILGRLPGNNIKTITKEPGILVGIIRGGNSGQFFLQ